MRFQDTSAPGSTEQPGSGLDLTTTTISVHPARCTISAVFDESERAILCTIGQLIDIFPQRDSDFSRAHELGIATIAADLRNTKDNPEISPQTLVILCEHFDEVRQMLLQLDCKHTINTTNGAQRTKDWFDHDFHFGEGKRESNELAIRIDQILGTETPQSLLRKFDAMRPKIISAAQEAHSNLDAD